MSVESPWRGLCPRRCRRKWSHRTPVRRAGLKRACTETDCFRRPPHTPTRRVFVVHSQMFSSSFSRTFLARCREAEKAPKKPDSNSGPHASCMFSCGLNGQGFTAATSMKFAGNSNLMLDRAVVTACSSSRWRNSPSIFWRTQAIRPEIAPHCGRGRLRRNAVCPTGRSGQHRKSCDLEHGTGTSHRHRVRIPVRGVRHTRVRRGRREITAIMDERAGPATRRARMAGADISQVMENFRPARCP